MKNIDVQTWTKINEPVGKLLGYPQCCIKEFCNQPPGSLENLDPVETYKIHLRWKASHIGPYYSGFIPCYAHALEILTGHTELKDLIQNRSAAIKPFPIEWGTI